MKNICARKNCAPTPSMPFAVLKSQLLILGVKSLNPSFLKIIIPAKSNGKYLYEIWPDATKAQVGKAYEGTTGLSDYADIPTQWKQ